MEAIHEQNACLEAYIEDSLDGGTTLSTRVVDDFNELSVQQGIVDPAFRLNAFPTRWRAQFLFQNLIFIH